MISQDDFWQLLREYVSYCTEVEHRMGCESSGWRTTIRDFIDMYRYHYKQILTELDKDADKV